MRFLLILVIILGLANPAFAAKAKKEKGAEPYRIGTYILGMTLDEMKQSTTPKDIKLVCSHDKKKPKGVGRKWLKLDKKMKAAKVSRCAYFRENDGELNPVGFYIGTSLPYVLDFLQDNDGQYRLMQVTLSFQEGQSDQLIKFLIHSYGKPNGEELTWDNGASEILAASDNGKEGMVVMAHKRLHNLSVERMKASGVMPDNDDEE